MSSSDIGSVRPGLPTASHIFSHWLITVIAIAGSFPISELTFEVYTKCWVYRVFGDPLELNCAESRFYFGFSARSPRMTDGSPRKSEPIR